MTSELMITPAISFRPRELLARLADAVERSRVRRHAKHTFAQIADGFAVFDRHWRYIYVNDQAAEIIGRRRDELIGHSPWELFPELAQSPLRIELERAVDEHVPVQIEHFEPSRGRWYENRAYPSDGGLAVFFVDITDRKRNDDALREANRRKDEFLAVLAHELRNPLAPMRLAAETMRTVGAADPAIGFSAGVIARQVTHMSRLVDDLLDIARIGRGEITLRVQRLALGEVIDAALEIARPVVGERKQRLIVRQASEPIYLEGDRVRLAEVIGNLLCNAAKFTAKAGAITLSTRAEDEDVVIKVSDTGRGISPEHLPHVFDLFFQVDQSPGRPSGGLGIGLTLARRLVALHGGRIEAKSKGEGKGSEFIVRLTRVAAGPSAAVVPEAARAERPTSPSHSILVVDDDVDAAQTMQLFLQTQGHVVRCAFDGASALRLAQEFDPQLVMIDIGMPEMGGYEVVRRLREQSNAKQPVIAAVSGYSDKPESERMSRLGIDHYFVKPITPDDLRTLVASLRE